jgi:CheY-like chemotaxis protein
MRILLADDQNEIRLLTKQHLESRGHLVVDVATGKDALRAIREERFDVVLLDEEMPGMTGTQILRALRPHDVQRSAIPFIALTGYNSEPDQQRLLQAGFDQVIGKPFRLDQLEALLLAEIQRRRGSPPPPPSTARSSPPVGDALARVGGDPQLLARVARIFLRDLPTRMKAMEKSIRQKRADILARQAHGLKGSLGVLAADPAAALCSKLQVCAQNANFTDAVPTFAALQVAIAELEPNLRGYAGQRRTTGPDAPPHLKTKRRTPDSKRKKP